jgi:hypothetical protein
MPPGVRTVVLRVTFAVRANLSIPDVESDGRKHALLPHERIATGRRFSRVEASASGTAWS